MKKIDRLKIGAVLLLLFFITQSGFAQNFILNDDGLIDKRAYEKINQIGSEVKSKLGVNIYINAVRSLKLAKNTSMKDKLAYIKKEEKAITSNLQKPYSLISLAVFDTHINLLSSKSLEKILDKDDILDGYIVPLLASKDKNTLASKVSAAMLNGYAAIADTIADSRGIELETSIGNQGKISGTIWRVFMYTLVIIGLLLYTFAVLRKKK